MTEATERLMTSSFFLDHLYYHQFSWASTTCVLSPHTQDISMAEFCLAVAAYAYLLESVPLRQTLVRQGGVDIIAMVECEASR